MINKFNTLKVSFLKKYFGKIKFFLLIVFVTGCWNYSVDDENEYLILCYNHAFGQRFSLSAQKAVDLSKGLYAIGFGQSRNAGMHLYLFIDSSLDIHSPKECGDFCDHPKYYSFLDINKNDQDFLYINRAMNLDNRILLLSKNNEGYVSSAESEFINKDIFPGLTLISIRGFLHPVFESKYSPLEIIIQKSNTGNSIFKTNGPVDYNRVYRFDIPEKLVEQIREHLNEDWITLEKKPMQIYYP